MRKAIQILFAILALGLFGNTQVTKIRSVTVLPATCAPGDGVQPADEVALVSGGVTTLEICTATNTWTAQAPIVSPAFTGTPTSPTPVIGDNSTKVATTAFVQNFSLASSRGVYAMAYGLHNDGHVFWDAVTTSGSATVTCADCNFTQSDVGKQVWATNLGSAGYTSMYAATCVIGCGTTASTISAVNSATSITVSTTATASTNPAVIVYGTDDTTALTNAWNATVSECATLILPGENNLGNGPAIMLVNQAQFFTGAGATQATCSLGSEAQRKGLGIVGGGVNATFIVPIPQFDFTSCTHGASGHACFGGIADGANLSYFSIWGSGISNVCSVRSQGGFCTSAVVLELGANPTNSTAHNSTASDIAVVAWGAASGNIGYGIQLDGASATYKYLTSDGAGGIGMFANSGMQSCLGCLAFDNGSYNLQVSNATFTTIGAMIGTSSNSAGCSINVLSSGLWLSYGDKLGYNGLTTGHDGICVAFGGSGAGEADLFGDDINYASSNANGIAAYVGATGTIKAIATKFKVTGTTSTGLYIDGSYFDLGGNTYSGATTNVNVHNGNYFGSPSVTGTIQTSANWSVPAGSAAGQWGASPSVATCTGDAHLQQCTITVGTGAIGSNPVLTVTHPTVFYATPICRAQQVGGTQGIGTFATGTVSTTSAAFTFQGTPTASNTLVVQVQCQ